MQVAAAVCVRAAVTPESTIGSRIGVATDARPHGTLRVGEALIVGAPVHVELASKVVDYWTTFAASGDPNRSGLPEWPRYDEATDPELVFEIKPATEEGRRSALCTLCSDVDVERWGQDWAVF